MLCGALGEVLHLVVTLLDFPVQDSEIGRVDGVVLAATQQSVRRNALSGQYVHWLWHTEAVVMLRAQ